MDRRRFLTGLGLMLAARLAAEAQPTAGQVRTVGVLSLADAISGRQIVEALRQGLRDQGWIEGQNLIMEYRWAQGRADNLAALAAEMVALKADVIVAATNQEIFAAKQATTTIPIVMLIAADPVGSGLIANLARPGGNVTGVSFDTTPETFGKHLELLKEVVPTLQRVLVLRNPELPGGAAYWKAAEEAAQKLGLTLRSVAIRTPEDLKSASAAMLKERLTGVMIFGDAVTYAARGQIVQLATQNGLPVVASTREYTEAGGLMSYGVHLPDLARRAATFVSKVLKGAKPADLPVEQPTKFELVINLKTAKALGLTIPSSVLARADEVIR
jgi:putative ABC transport system substrate-binding protein